MELFILLLTTGFFLAIGVVGFVDPNRIIMSFGAKPAADMRNEVRTVYGGMCLALGLAGIGAVLHYVPVGWIASVFALILISNAAGRSIGLLIERSSKIMLIYLAIEIILGFSSLYLAVSNNA